MEYKGSTQLPFYLHNPNEHIHLEKNVFEPRSLHSVTFEPNTFKLSKSYTEFGPYYDCSQSQVKLHGKFESV